MAQEMSRVQAAAEQLKKDFNALEKRHVIELYDVGGQQLFPIYGASGGLTASYAAYLMFRRPKRHPIESARDFDFQRYVIEGDSPEELVANLPRAVNEFQKHLDHLAPLEVDKILTVDELLEKLKPFKGDFQVFVEGRDLIVQVKAGRIEHQCEVNMDGADLGLGTGTLYDRIFVGYYPLAKAQNG